METRSKYKILNYQSQREQRPSPLLLRAVSPTFPSNQRNEVIFRIRFSFNFSKTLICFYHKHESVPFQSHRQILKRDCIRKIRTFGLFEIRFLRKKFLNFFRILSSLIQYVPQCNSTTSSASSPP
ncbi:hypothetical protein LEP1GSC133_4298 [Leptospira borgpetersenii serovar Pomona str. 200901868]|uniref:Uncharacterized protein n=1 Tax=Leptospira borgpetersenii serovar Pomona str. 200901868 TaxID=1192866 RepID=M6W178_LEPBO|nr:hypothetical protein LEP1GSC133_4298 [Leptospira borgpetersenii serovar Pomona str. 200901868]